MGNVLTGAARLEDGLETWRSGTSNKTEFGHFKGVWLGLTILFSVISVAIVVFILRRAVAWAIAGSLVAILGSFLLASLIIVGFVYNAKRALVYKKRVFNDLHKQGQAMGFSSFKNYRNATKSSTNSNRRKRANEMTAKLQGKTRNFLRSRSLIEHSHGAQPSIGGMAFGLLTGAARQLKESTSNR